MEQTPNKPPKNFIQDIIDERLDKLTARKIADYTRRYAVDDEGKIDKDLACIIKREVLRRSSMGRELDIYEPFRWTMVAFVLSSVAGIGLKYALGEKVDKMATNALLATTALGSGINLLRLESRFEAGLRGGLDTAFAMAELEKKEKRSSDIKR